MENTNTYPHNTPPDFPPSSMFLHISELPLSRFIDVSVTGSLYPLIISGHPSEDDLQNAWALIVDQYTSAIGDGEQQLSLSLYKEIHKLSSLIESVELLVKTLKDTYNGKLVSKLNELLGSNYYFDVTNPEEYDRTLQRCISRSKGYKLTLDMKLMQYQALKEKQATGEGKATREYFQSILLTLRSAEGYFIEADRITVFEYCEMIRRVNKKIEDLEKQKR